MDDFMKLASMEYGISPLPENPVPAMAYVPYQQLEAVYGVEQRSYGRNDFFLCWINRFTRLQEGTR